MLAAYEYRRTHLSSNLVLGYMLKPSAEQGQNQSLRLGHILQAYLPADRQILSPSELRCDRLHMSPQEGYDSQVGRYDGNWTSAIL